MINKIVESKILDNKPYIYGTLWLCVLTYLLNYCTAIYQCALVFTIIAITANALTYFYNESKALRSAAFAILMSFALLWKLPYHIDGRIVNGLVFASLLSLLVSVYWSTSVFQKLTSKFSFVTSNALSLIIAAVIDGVVMGLFFTVNKNFSYERALDIFSRELSYKMIYGIAASAIIFFILKILKTNNKSLNHN